MRLGFWRSGGVVRSVVIFTTVLMGVAMAGGRPVAALSEDQKGAISQYCGTIRQTLRTIQYEDSRTRIAVGAVYETLMSRFITPLNLRLVSNNMANSDLVDFQAKFAAERGSFTAKFVEYSRALERLISADCQRDPEGFYAQLEVTRNLRSEVNALVMGLNKSTVQYRERLVALKESL